MPLLTWLMRCELTRLETFQVGVRQVSEEDVKCVVAAVAELLQLQKLVLNGPAFADCVAVVVEVVGVQGWLRELDLGSCPIGDDGATHLAAALQQNCSLLALTVVGCGICNVGLVRLGRALTRNTTLRKLDATFNPFTAEGVVRFSRMMDDMHGLQVLKLSTRWEQLLPGIERNYSLLELPGIRRAKPYLARSARGYDKARAATLAWLCISRLASPNGITRDIGLIIACLVYASRGWSCWAGDAGAGRSGD